MGKRKSFIRITCLVLAVLMVLSLLTVVVSSGAYADSSSIREQINALEDEQDEIQARMDEYENEIAGIDEEKTNVVERKAVLDQKNLLAQEEIDVIEEQIEIIDGLVTNMQMDLAEAQYEEDHQRERWLTRVRAMEEGSTLNYIQVLFDATSFSDLLTRIDLVNEIIEYDRNLEASYVAAREAVEILEAEAEVMFALNEVSRTELEIKKAQLEADIESANQLIADMEQDIESYKELLALEEAEEASVMAEIAALEAEYAEAKAREEAAWLAQQQQQQQGSGSGSSGNAGVTGNSGTYLWPSYTSAVSSYYGYRIHPVYGYYKFHYGVDISAAGGTDIWAITDGTVITSTYGSGYGNYVVIRHDDGNYSLYAHMSSRAVSVGQYVSRGQVIGLVGTTGVSTGYHIHFEVWNSSQNKMDPMGYHYIYA